MTLPPIDRLTPEVRAVVFDLDGTLYDKRRLPFYLVLRNLWTLPLLAAERLTRKQLRGQYIGSEQAFYDSFFATMCKGHCFSERLARWWYFRYYMPSMVSIIRRHCRLNQGVELWLEQCKQRQIPMVVFSDYGFVAEKLHAIGLPMEAFTWIVSAPGLGGLKPARQCLEKVIARLQVPAQSCLFIGDRKDTDGASALAIGAQFALVE